MPYKLQKVRNQPLYYVINVLTKKKFSKEPMIKEKAEKQLIALRINSPR